MTATAESLMNTLLELPEEDRMEIVERLQDSIFDTSHSTEEITDELKATLDRRWEEIESGKVKCEDAFVVLERIKRRHLERNPAAS